MNHFRRNLHFSDFEFNALQQIKHNTKFVHSAPCIIQHKKDLSLIKNQFGELSGSYLHCNNKNNTLIRRIKSLKAPTSNTSTAPHDK